MHEQKHLEIHLDFYENFLKFFYILDLHALPYQQLSSLLVLVLKNLLRQEHDLHLFDLQHAIYLLLQDFLQVSIHTLTEDQNNHYPILLDLLSKHLRCRL